MGLLSMAITYTICKLIAKSELKMTAMMITHIPITKEPETGCINSQKKIKKRLIMKEMIKQYPRSQLNANLRVDLSHGPFLGKNENKAAKAAPAVAPAAV